MASEVQTLNKYPYSATTLVITTYADGYRAVGTAALVGSNDLLTATHVVYAPDHGGWATQLEVYAAVDYNSATGRFESQPLVQMGRFQWDAYGYPDQVFSVGSNLTVTYGESQYDMAIIGLSKAIGARLGWFGIDAGHDTPQWAYQLGYPEGSTGMIEGRAYVTKENGYEVYSANSASGSDILGPGSSGGPLFVYDANGKAQIIGVKSSGSTTESHWADIGWQSPMLERLIASNGNLLGSSMVSLTGTAGNDSWKTGRVDERFDGGAGHDEVTFLGARADYHIQHESGTQFAVGALKDGMDGNNLLQDVELLRFSDYTVDLTVQDIAARHTTAQVNNVIELYHGFFNRIPDASGLAYWLGQQDTGMSLRQMGDAFFNAALVYADYTGYARDMSPDAFIRTVYKNVLERDSVDAGGMAYWQNKLATGEETRASFIQNVTQAAHVYKGDATWGWVADAADNKLAVSRAFSLDMALGWNTAAESITKGKAIAEAVTPTSTLEALKLIGIDPAIHDIV